MTTCTCLYTVHVMYTLYIDCFVSISSTRTLCVHVHVDVHCTSQQFNL